MGHTKQSLVQWLYFALICDILTEQSILDLKSLFSEIIHSHTKFFLDLVFSEEEF